jgi:hypothetical protein
LKTSSIGRLAISINLTMPISMAINNVYRDSLIGES